MLMIPQPYVPAAFYSPEIFFLLLVLVFLEAELTPGPSAAGRKGKLKNNSVTLSSLEPATFRLLA
jgi:hypothetical protein